MEEKKPKTHRVNLNLPLTTLNRVKEYANKQGIPDTSAYIILLNIGLDNIDFLHNAPNYFDTLKEDIKHIVINYTDKE